MRVVRVGLSALLGAFVLAVVPQSAASADVPTENGVMVRKAIDAVDFDKRTTTGCRLNRERPTLTVSCSRRGATSLEYSLSVPAKAIDFRISRAGLSETGLHELDPLTLLERSRDALEVTIDLHHLATESKGHGKGVDVISELHAWLR